MRIILAAFLSVIGVIPPAFADVFTVGPWTGQPFYTEADGGFAHCAMWANYETGDTLMFSITNDGSLLLGIANDGWKLGTGDSYPVALHIDRRNLGEYEAVASDELTVYVDLPYSDELVRLLRSGKLLRIQTKKQILSFKLTGGNAAMLRLQDCVYEELFAGRTAQNPFGDGAAGQHPFGNQEQRPARRDDGQPPASPQDSQAEDRRLVRNMLDEAGLDEFKYMGPEEFADWAPNVIMGWSSDAVIGMVVPLGGLDFDIGLAASIVIGRHEEACKGRFTYAVAPAAFADGSPVRRVIAKCDKAADSSSTGLILFQRKGSTVVIMHMGAMKDANLVVRADEAVFRTFSGK